MIERATVRPARAMGRPDLGTLRVGAPADVALFRLEEGDFTFYDVFMAHVRAPAGWSYPHHHGGTPAPARRGAHLCIRGQSCLPSKSCT